MGRRTDDPVQHVISFRVNEEEKIELTQMADTIGVSISTLMRHSIAHLSDRDMPIMNGKKDS